MREALKVLGGTTVTLAVIAAAVYVVLMPYLGGGF
jgi:hypothetical protein